MAPLLFAPRRDVDAFCSSSSSFVTGTLSALASRWSTPTVASVLTGFQLVDVLARDPCLGGQHRLAHPSLRPRVFQSHAKLYRGRTHDSEVLFTMSRVLSCFRAVHMNQPDGAPRSRTGHRPPAPGSRPPTTAGRSTRPRRGACSHRPSRSPARDADSSRRSRWRSWIITTCARSATTTPSPRGGEGPPRSTTRAIRAGSRPR
jgi:hypothetical protein